MKKTLLYILLFLSIIIPLKSHSMNPADFLIQMPSNFTPGCYGNYYKIPVEKLSKYTYYRSEVEAELKKDNFIISQYNFILPYIADTAQEKHHKYTASIFPEIQEEGKPNFFQYLNDNNQKTALKFQVEDTESEVIIKLKKPLISGSFSFKLNYLSKFYLTSFRVSEDGTDYKHISFPDIQNHSFKYLKIVFRSLEKKPVKEVISISELSFLKNNSAFIFQSFFAKDIEIYSGYNCEKEVGYKIQKSEYEFDTSIATTDINISLEQNPSYDYYTGLDEAYMKEHDPDNDLILNRYDNCRYIANPEQKDSDNDNVGDVCDNCKNFSNFKQIDTNENGVGDLCEDQDGDGIIGHKDNCIDVANFNQADDNKNGIGNFCEDTDYDGIDYIDDNCPKIYNPYQIDTDQDLIGDACDEKDNSKVESSENILYIIFISIGVLFGLIIFIWLGRIVHK